MAETVLKIENLGISCGGLKAVQNLNLEIKEKQLYGLVGPNGAGKTTVFNMITGVYKPTTGSIYLDGEQIDGLSQEKINHKGIARTFQNIRLFKDMSVIDNVKVGLHNDNQYSMFTGIFRLPPFRKVEKDNEKESFNVLDRDNRSLSYIDRRIYIRTFH